MGNTSSIRRSRRHTHREQSEAGTSAASQNFQNGPPQYPGSSQQTRHPQNALPGAAQAQNQVHHTTTVRNLVNLKKHTLKLAPSEDAPHILNVSFSLDVVSQCSVSIFLLGKEDSGTGEITAEKVICDRVVCEIGMNIKFPFEGMSSEQSTIDTSGYSAEELNAADLDKWQYPLIIRLETLASKEDASSHSLVEREAGVALVPWIQSQTTYVVLGETSPDADDDSRVVRQRIWVQSQFYQLQEIYGITEANQASNSDGDFSADCVVCLTNRKNTTVLPCRHFCMCNECAKLLLKRTRTCPMCRLPISSVLYIQIPSTKSE